MNAHLFPKLWLLISWLFIESDRSRAKRLVKSLSFSAPGSLRTRWHRFWQPIRESETLAGKFISFVFRTQNGWQMQKMRDHSAQLMIAGAVGILMGAVFMLLLDWEAGIAGVAISFSLFAISGSFLAVLMVGWDHYVQWKSLTFDGEELGKLPFILPGFVLKRVREVEDKAKKEGAYVYYRHEQTVKDPIVTATIIIGGHSRVVTLGIYDKKDKQTPMFE